MRFNRTVLCLTIFLALWLNALNSAAAGLEKPIAQKILCRAKASCTVTELRAAGRVGAESLWVATLALGGGDNDDSCRPFEHWLVTQKVDGSVSQQLLLKICNDGYGARGLGEDQIEVTPNSFMHMRTGGSAWMWSQTTKVQLAPVAIIAEGSGSFWTLGSVKHDELWTWRDWSGFASGAAPLCVEDENATPRQLDYAYQPIPRVSLDDEFRADDWRTADFASCATRLDSRGGASEKNPGGGFVIHGKPTPRVEVAIQVLLSSQSELFIHVEDPTLVMQAASWVLADHLEIWLGAPVATASECMNALQPLQQWGIDLYGNVNAAFGAKNIPLEVERAQIVTANKANAIRFKVQLPAALAPPDRNDWLLTVAYSDSDDGKRQKRIIATSRLQYGVLPTLGRLRDIAPKFAVCRREGETRRAINTRTFTPNQPVIAQ